jgi:UDPglucose 6-dehydrogenase
LDVVVIGIGRVGLVAACCLAKSGHSVTAVENNGAKLELLQRGSSPLREHGIEALLKQSINSGRLRFVPSVPTPLKTDLVMVTVNTPPLDDGSADLSQVFAAVQQVKKATGGQTLLVMKSTVPPGTGDYIVKTYLANTNIEYVANPEFLRAGTAIDDWYHPSRTVIGTRNPEVLGKLKVLYTDITAPVIVTSITSAEMIKYAANAFLATKISFINEVANLCEAVGANIDDVVKGLGLDPRIGTAHLQPGIGYGGACLPKDAAALEHLAASKGYDFKLLKATIEVNARQRQLVVHKLANVLGTLKGKKIALLGLAFKPGTDDITGAPAVDIARILIAEGAEVCVHDPMAMESARSLLPGSMLFCPDIYSAVAGACAIILATEWPQLLEADWNKVKKGMVEPYAIIDGRNALPKDRLVAAGFKYIGIGR